MNLKEDKIREKFNDNVNSVECLCEISDTRIASPIGSYSATRIAAPIGLYGRVATPVGLYGASSP